MIVDIRNSPCWYVCSFCSLGQTWDGIRSIGNRGYLYCPCLHANQQTTCLPIATNMSWAHSLITHSLTHSSLTHSLTPPAEVSSSTYLYVLTPMDLYPPIHSMLPMPLMPPTASAFTIPTTSTGTRHQFDCCHDWSSRSRWHCLVPYCYCSTSHLGSPPCRALCIAEI